MQDISDFSACLNQLNAKPLLRFVSCGSVDDGKSSLIGRLLYETHQIAEDQLSSLEHSLSLNTDKERTFDYARLLDGLSAEQEQGITIDVAHRYFQSRKRSFIVADTPGHEQYTRNMATAASNSDVAVLLVDARKGLLSQSKRHSYILSLFGVKDFVLAVNKMDLVQYEAHVFKQIEKDFSEFAQFLGLKQLTVIPVSALKGDNITMKSQHMLWYQGATLLETLESIEPKSSEVNLGFRMPVQWVNRAHADFRGYAGQVAAGHIKAGDKVLVLPSAKASRVRQIFFDKQVLETAHKGQSILLTLEDEIDISRGDVLVDFNNPAATAEQFKVSLCWFDEKPMIIGRQYLIKTATCLAFATLVKINHQLDVDTMALIEAQELSMNEIGCCELALDRKIAFEAYEHNKTLGAFILIDRISNATAAAGIIHSQLSRSQHLFKQDGFVTQDMRSEIKHQKPVVLWFTGLSGAGKSTLANLLEKKLNALGLHTMLLDGDNIRQGLNRDLGFSESCRAENIRRIAEVAKLMSEAGLVTLVSFISPYAAEREMARERIGRGQFLEIFVDAPIAVVESRDPKGLYRKARQGLIKEFTGIDSPYEPPENPDVRVDTSMVDETQSVQQLIDFLTIKQFI